MKRVYVTQCVKYLTVIHDADDVLQINLNQYIQVFVIIVDVDKNTWVGLPPNVTH